MAVTMRDVAERAGVSIATVSFVVNDTKRVSPATRHKIESAMAELGFHRNAVARARASRRTRMIALVYPAFDHLVGATPADEIVTSAARAARAADHHLVVSPMSNDSSELADLVGQGLVDGVLLMHVQLDDARAAFLRTTDTPFAMIGRTRDVTGLACADIDFDESLRVALDHLHGLGHRRIGLVSGTQDVPDFRAYGPYVRLAEAFRRQSAERGLDPLLLECRQTSLAGRELATRLASERLPVTALVVANDFVVIGLLAGLQAQHVQVPRELSVLSILSSSSLAGMTEPTLAMVTTPGAELGRRGVEALLRRLNGAPPQPPELCCGELVPGGSTGPAPPPTA